jgi:hypothetical protein
VGGGAHTLRCIAGRRGDVEALEGLGAVFLAWRGREVETRSLIDPMVARAIAAGQGIDVQVARWLEAVLFNGAAPYAEALGSAVEACCAACEVVISAWALPELVEATVKSREPELGRRALERLAKVATVAATDGIWTSSRAAARCSATGRLPTSVTARRSTGSRTRFRPELARAHLLYGEWLRRAGRRVEARELLRAAFQAIGMEGLGSPSEPVSNYWPRARKFGSERTRSATTSRRRSRRSRSSAAKGSRTPRSVHDWSLAHAP